jgi:hypothetical protein
MQCKVAAIYSKDFAYEQCSISFWKLLCFLNFEILNWGISARSAISYTPEKSFIEAMYGKHKQIFQAILLATHYTETLC